MGAAVSITRLDLTASELRKAAGREKNSTAARRILALALVLDGVDRKTAAATCGMDRQTLRDWVHRYNAAGLAGVCTDNLNAGVAVVKSAQDGA
jgi:Homeodomain-like domain